MKTKISLLIIMAISSLMMNAQNIMNIHQSNGTVLEIPINTIDSITYSLTGSGNIVTNPGAGVTFDGFTYSSIVLGNGQEWMKNNLRTNIYANGDPIPNVTDPTQWTNLTSGAWAHYGNFSQNEDMADGKLYNWYTVVDPRNLCPTGWHVPTDAEWTVLTDYLGGESVAGGKMKVTGTNLWTSPNTDATNESGFTGFPAGYLHELGGPFYDMGDLTFWWSSSEFNNGAYCRLLQYDNGESQTSVRSKNSGLSVRCLKD